ncbi:MAG: rod-determining factor RdfA [Haloferacaceae archaeon]
MVTKVERVIEAYGLTIGEELADRWRGEGYERESLRALADRFNEAVLGAAMREAGLRPLEGEAANTYRLLTDDGVSAGMRTQARRRLERAGIDVSDLRSDFVSHQAIHTYLTDERGVSPPTDGRSPAERLADDRETIQRLESRLEAVTDNTLDRLVRTDQLSIGDPSVIVDVQVFCADCGQQYAVGDLLGAGHCDCTDP